MTIAGSPAAATNVGRPILGGRRLSIDWVGAVPYLVYVGLFLVLPSVIIGIGAFLDANNAFTLDNFRNLSRSYVLKATIDTTVLSAITALLGAVFGALLAYAIVTGTPNGILRRVTLSASGVLAQFGGVTLAFAFIAAAEAIVKSGVKLKGNLLLALGLGAALMLGSTSVLAQEGGHESPQPPRNKWSFAGAFGKFDEAQLQRGFKIYCEV